MKFSDEAIRLEDATLRMPEHFLVIGGESEASPSTHLSDMDSFLLLEM
jgi:hypothetical protein